MSRPLNPLNPMDRRKQRIDDLAASAAGPRASDREPASGNVLVVDDAGTVDEAPGVSLIASAWRRLRRDPVFLVGAAIIAVFIVLAIISPWIAPHDPAAGLLLDRVRPQSNPIPGPEPGFPLGADDKGRDLLSRLMVGSRQTLIVGTLATVIGLIGGLVLGILSGAFGGAIDAFVMRVVDVLLSIPSLLLAL